MLFLNQSRKYGAKIVYQAPAGDGEGGEGGDGGDGGDGAGDDDEGAGGDGAGDDEGAAAKLKADNAKLLKETMKRKKELTTLRSELDSLKSTLGDVDVDEYKRLREEAATRKAEEQSEEQKRLEAKGEWDRLKAQMVEQHQTRLTELQGQLDELTGSRDELTSQIHELTIGNSFGQSKYIADELNLSVAKTRQLYGSQFEYTESGVVAYDKPAGAKDRTMLVDEKGEPLDFDSAIAKIVDADPDRELLKKAVVKGGAGSRGNQGRTTDEGDKGTKGLGRIQAGLSSAIGAKK